MEKAKEGRIDMYIGEISFVNDEGIKTIEHKGTVVRDMSPEQASAHLIGVTSALIAPAQAQVK